MDDTIGAASQDMRIDTRILKHLLREATELLEEAQTHALVEKQEEATAHVLARTNWRMNATCLWAIGELFPASGDTDKSAQLHAPGPVFSCETKGLSPQFASFVQRVDSLHERARRLDELSRGPVVSSAPGMTIVTSDTMPAVAETRPAASVVPLFGNTANAPAARSNPVEQARSTMRRVMAGRD